MMIPDAETEQAVSRQLHIVADRLSIDLEPIEPVLRLGRRHVLRRRASVALSAALVVAVFAWVALSLSGMADGSYQLSNGATIPKPEVVARIPLAQADDPLEVAVGEGAVWVTGGAGTLHRIDPATNRIIATLSFNGHAGAIAVGSGSVWVATHHPDALLRLDPATNQVQEEIQLPGYAREVVAGPSTVWAVVNVDLLHSAVVRVDPSTNRVEATIDVTIDATSGFGLVLDGDTPWLADCAGRTLTQIGPARAGLTNPIPLPACPWNAIAEGGIIWMSTESEMVNKPGSVWSVDPSTGVVGPMTLVANNTAEMAFADGALFVLNGGSAWTVSTYLSIIDPSNGHLVGSPLLVGNLTDSVAAGEGSLWVLNQEPREIVRVNP